jgi:drug/metabolite transporter (DMT)-like permease
MTLIWSINYVIAKIALLSFPPLLIGCLRAAFAAILLVPVYLVLRHRRNEPGEPWSARDILTVAVLGVFGITLNQIFFVVGINRTSVAHAALLIATTPLQVMLVAALRGQESITWRKTGGMLVAVAGIAVLNLAPGREARGATFLGDLFVFLAAFSFTLYTVFGKEVTRRHDSITITALGYFAGALAGAPILVCQARNFRFADARLSGWLALAYMALLSSITCYLIFYYALSHMSATRLTAFSYAQPVIAALAGAVVLGEAITLPVAAAGVLVLSGVWLTGRSA